MTDEIIEVESEVAIPQTGLEIAPFGLEGSAISGVKAERGNKLRPTLFIGGPLDGQTRPMPADGRMHDENFIDYSSGEFISHRYIPAIVTFDNAQSLVYVLLERIRQAPLARRLRNENQSKIEEQKRLGISNER